jgi:isoquinoline 1-oxidoreductase subunit beta
VPDKVNGRAQYAIDVQLPGMLYGAVLRAPVEGAAPDRIDDAKARAAAGVVKVIRLPYGVGVVAETPWAAFEAKRALAGAVTWTKTGKAWGFDSDTGLAAFAAAARDLNQPGTDWSRPATFVIC